MTTGHLLVYLAIILLGFEVGKLVRKVEVVALLLKEIRDVLKRKDPL